MKKKKNIKLILLFLLIGLTIIGMVTVIYTQNYIRQQREVEEKMNQLKEIAMTYARLNSSFGIASLRTDFLVPNGGFLPLESNEHNNVNWTAYMGLRMYESRTGIYLSYDMVRDYFSREYELDGTLRLYNNGKHPEIEAYVNWREQTDPDEIINFFNRIREIYAKYVSENWEDGFMHENLSYVSLEMLDALARKEADPNYELDLTSLMQQED